MQMSRFGTKTSKWVEGSQTPLAHCIQPRWAHAFRALSPDRVGKSAVRRMESASTTVVNS